MKNEKVNELVNKIEEGVKTLFESEKYKNYLNVMSRFHDYSFNNTLLISMQRPDATYVAGYNTWKQLDRHVVEGAKGIQIIQPCPIKEKELVELKDEDGNKIYDNKGQPMTEQVEHIQQRFKVGYVFSYEDTEGEPLPELVTNLKDNVKNFEQFKQVIEIVSPAPIVYEQINSKANGFYHLESRDIHIRDDLSELQTIKTAIHEIAHCFLHDKEEGTDIDRNRREKEVEAESVAYTVCSYFGLDTSEYSFGYIAGWASNKSVPELKDCMNQIKQTAGTIIDLIETELLRIKMEQSDSLAYKFPDGYFFIDRVSDNHYEYSFTDRAGNIEEADGIDIDMNIKELADLLASSRGKDMSNAMLSNTESVGEMIEKQKQQQTHETIEETSKITHRRVR